MQLGPLAGNVPENNMRYAIPNLNMLTDEDLAKMRFVHLETLRDHYTSQEDQNRLSPFAHRAYAREVGTENPLLGYGSAVAAPVYQALKQFEEPGLSRSQPSWNQTRQGLIGAGEGMYAGIQNAAQNMYSGIQGLMR